MSTKRPRPVITIVEARPMSEIGFRAEKSTPPLSSTDKPSSPDGIPANSTVRHSSDSSISASLNRSTNRPARPAPVRPQHNIQGFDTSSTGHLVHTEPKQSAATPAPSAVPVPVPREVRHSPPEQRRRPSPDVESIENGCRTTGEPRPVPRPRPRSMIVKPARQLTDDKQQLPSAAEKQANPTRPTIIRRPATDSRPTTMLNYVDSEGQGKSAMSTSRSMDFDRSSKIDKPLPAIPAVKPKPGHMWLDEDVKPPQQPVDGSRRKPTIIRASVAGTGVSSQPGSSVDAPTLPQRPAAAVAPQVSEAARPSQDQRKASQPAVFLHDGSASFHADGALVKPAADKAESSSIKPSSRQHPESLMNQKPKKPDRLSKTTTWYTDESFGSKKSPEENISNASAAGSDAAPFHGLRKTVPAVAHPAVKITGSEAANPPQPKKRPTIIRMDKQPSAAAADGSNSKQELEPSQATDASVTNRDEGGVTETPTTSSPELENLRNHSLESFHGIVETTQTIPSANQTRTPVPRARQQRTDNAPNVVEPAKKAAPSKPPPPRSAAAPKAEETVHTKESADIAVEPNQPKEGRPPHPVIVRPQHPPARPTVPPVNAPKGSPPSLPHRPTLGHPLYHYVVKGPHALALFDFVSAQPDELSFTAGQIVALEKWISAEWMVGSTGHGRGMFPVNFVEIVEPLPAGPITSVAPRHVEEVTTVTATSHTTPSIKPVGQVSSPLPSGPHCIARFDYEAGEPGDLDFVSGDIIRLVERVGDDWLRGELHGKTGIFPLAFVEILQDLPAEALVKANDNSSMPANNWPPSSPVKADLAPLSPLKTDFQPPSPVAKVATLPRSSPTKPRSVASSPSASPGRIVEDDGRPYCIAAFEFEGETPDDLNFQVGDRISLTGRINAEWLRGKLDGREGIFPEAFVNIIRDIGHDLPPRPKVAIPPMLPTYQTPSSCPSSPARNYVTNMSTSPTAISFAPSPLRAIALFDYEGDVSAGDLCFRAGETIEDVQSISTDWMSGRIGQKTGQFPMAFIQIS